MKNETIKQLYFPKLNEEIIIGYKIYVCHSVDLKKVGMDACLQCDIDRDAKNAPCPEIEGDYYIELAKLFNLINDIRMCMLSVTYRDWETDRKSTRLNSSHSAKSRMPSSA